MAKICTVVYIIYYDCSLLGAVGMNTYFPAQCLGGGNSVGGQWKSVEMYSEVVEQSMRFGDIFHLGVRTGIAILVWQGV